MRLHVGAFTSRTDGLGVRDGLWKDAEIDTNLDFLLIFDSGQQERIVSISKLKRGARWHLFAKESVIVLLVQDDLLLGQPDILEHLIEIECPLTDVVIRLEEVKVPSLHDKKQGILPWRLHIEENTPVEGGSARRASEVSIRVLLIVVIDVGANENIGDALKVLTGHILSVHDRETDLIVLDRLRLNIPDLLLLGLLVRRLNLQPACDNTLRK